MTCRTVSNLILPRLCRPVLHHYYPPLSPSTLLRTVKERRLLFIPPHVKFPFTPLPHAVHLLLSKHVCPLWHWRTPCRLLRRPVMILLCCRLSTRRQRWNITTKSTNSRFPLCGRSCLWNLVTNDCTRVYAVFRGHSVLETHAGS